jgi:hypothetical protein
MKTGRGGEGGEWKLREEEKDGMEWKLREKEKCKE